MDFSSLNKYFPELSQSKIKLLQLYAEILLKRNQELNLISRKDTENFCLHHLVHSLSLSLFIQFTSGSSVLDLGTGGGLPGIPLAIAFPDSDFVLCDSVGKKINAVNEFIDVLDLSNAQTFHGRAQDLKTTFNYVVSRATIKLPDLFPWGKKLLKKTGRVGKTEGFWLYKGGDLESEMLGFNNKIKLHCLADKLEDPYFDSKYLLHLSV